MGKITIINPASVGLALFLASNSLLAQDALYEIPWIEVIPSLLSLVQPLSFATMLFIGALLSYFRPNFQRSNFSFLCGPIMIVGYSLFIFDMSAFGISSIAAFVTGSLLLGCGMALFFLLWQRYFSSESDDQGTADIIVGKGLPIVFFTASLFISNFIVQYVIAVVYICIAEFCLIIKTKTIDFQQPIFADNPRSNSFAYKNVLALVWPSAICVGSVGLVGSLLRSLAIDGSATSFVVTFAALVGMLVAAIVMFALWRRYSFRFDVVSVFRKVYPVLALFLLAVPFLGQLYPEICYGINYVFFSFLITIMMIQCAQISKRFGVRPGFVYGIYAGIVYLLMLLGNVVSLLLRASSFDSHLALVTLIAFIAVWVLGFALFVARGQIDPQDMQYRGAEFLTLDRHAETHTKKPTEEAHGSQDKSQKWLGKPLPDKAYKDRLAKQCAIVAKRYYLTVRESEVMELLARGNTVPDISKELVVSESTIQTHCKKLYLKLDVHKRRDLIALINAEELS